MNALSLLAAEDVACCEDETWAQIPDWPHEASTCGRVRSVDRLGDDGIWRLGGMLPPQLDKRPGKGYGYYDLRDGSRRRRIPAAVAVLEAHDKPRPGPEYEACHGNDIRTDNHRVNLAWDTKTANLAKMWEARRQQRPLDDPVTSSAPQWSRRGQNGHKSQVREGSHVIAGSVTAVVTGDRSQGTGTSRPFQSFPSVLTSVQPLVHALRTSFRPLRNRQAA